MKPTLESLDLLPSELESAKEVIRTLAYLKWVEAGRPEGSDAKYWLEAEREWIECDYVPHRPWADEPRIMELNVADELAST